LWNEGILRERKKAEDKNDSTEKSVIRCGKKKKMGQPPKVLVD
jgi:hypothetical protein